YDPSFEWPGGDDGPSQAVASSLAIPSLRLIRLPEHGTKPALPRIQKLANIDGYTEVELGRDLPPPGSDKPRIRLKDMEVSKIHATIYWDMKRHEWAIVDMGSKHGTFVLSYVSPTAATASSASPGPNGQRLSLPRTASIPRQLRHLDRLSVGGTTFLIHIHEDCLPCKECIARGGDDSEITLFNTRQAATSSKRKRDSSLETSTVSSYNPKKALSVLKRSLLSRHDGPSNSSDRGTYIDRSARRTRDLHPDAPNIPGEQNYPIASFSYPSLPTPPPELPRPPSPPGPPTSSNIGHRLLMKQGWAPGTALRSTESSADDSISSIDLVNPLEPKGRTSRAGLGLLDSSYPSQHGQGTSWMDERKYRRWA
ncbi:hypothetical protein BDY19DRAFT_857551, partial [Irpex rosettiformis]